MTLVENQLWTLPAVLHSKSHGAGKTGETWPIYILWLLPWAWQKFFYSMMQRALMMHPLRMTINKIKFATSSEKERYHTLYVYKYNICTWMLKKIQFLDYFLRAPWLLLTSENHWPPYFGKALTCSKSYKIKFGKSLTFFKTI